MKKRISLVLGSGGARGIAHIGIIDWLEENDYEIVAISGCSMGALVGGFYAAGKFKEIKEWFLGLDNIELLKLVDFKGSGGLISGSTLMEKLGDILGDVNIEDLDIEFTSVSAEVNEEKEIWISKGSLLKAIRASISLPLFFTPYEYNGHLLIDGGVLNPVPIAPTFDDGTELTIAVNLGGLPDAELDKPEEISYSSIIMEHIKDIPVIESVHRKYSMSEIADKSFDSMQATIARMKLAAYPPDIEITIPRNLCGTLEFNRAKELIEYGYNICEKVLKDEK